MPACCEAETGSLHLLPSGSCVQSQQSDNTKPRTVDSHTSERWYCPAKTQQCFDLLSLDAATLPSIAKENPSLDCTPITYVALGAVVYRYPWYTPPQLASVVICWGFAKFPDVPDAKSDLAAVREE